MGCSDQTVRNAIKAFEREGIQCLDPKPSRPKTITPEIDDHNREQLFQLLHKSPRSFGKARSIWTLRLLADVCGETGITTRRVSEETIRDALKRLAINWKRAKHWMSSPDPQYDAKKNAEIA